jgi:polysaccharide biosynthesis protein PslH
MNASGMEKPSVLIIGPPWPQSGTARLFENQVEFYRSQGLSTIFIAVPIDCWYVESYPEWEGIRAGLAPVGADWMLNATINQRRFLKSKYTVWAQHVFRPTALDWIIMTGASADLSLDSESVIRKAQVKLIHVNHVFTLGFAKRILRTLVGNGRQVPIILETHDIQAQLLIDRGDINQWTHRADRPNRLVKSEDANLADIGVFLHCSIDDLEYFSSRTPNKAHILALPTIDETFVTRVRESQSQTQPIDLLFVGQSTEPNLMGIKWFLEEVWPLMADKGYRLSIVGKVELLVRENLPELYNKFCKYFAGHVSDLAGLYASARCVFAPMMSGTGISVKTVEALAVGKPFVGTSKAYRGMPMERLNEFGLRAHDTPQSFAGAIAEALANGSAAAKASRQTYEALFSKKAAFAARDKAFKIAASPDEHERSESART